MKLVRKYKFILAIMLLIIITIVIILNKQKLLNNSDYIVSNDDSLLKEEIVDDFSKIYVDIKGAIVNPGVYEVDSDMIVNDVIKLAGGLKDNADTSIINLAKRVSDGDLIIIYTKEEVENSNIKDVETVVKVVDKECVCPNIQNDACICNTESNDDVSNVDETSSTQIEDTITNGNTTDGKININTATLEQLMELSGIGEAKANAIIAYRNEKGKFKSIEDIKDVSGIGEALYEKIKDNITV